MALTFEVPDQGSPITLEEYLAYIREVDVRDFDAFCASAPMFNRLLRNKRLLTERLNAELAAWRTFQTGNVYTGPVMLLEANETFIVRANIWQKPETYDDPRLSDDSVYSYLDVHDHNFDFMTGGYLGSGYETSIWEWEGTDRWPRDGEVVDIRFLERTRLPEGKIMAYRGSRDIHRQEHPDEFSISLNLLVRPPANGFKQYCFDVDNSKVVSSIGAGGVARESICDMARLLADDETCGLLEDIGRTHLDPTLRGAAVESLVRLSVLEIDDARRWAAADGHPYVNLAVGRAAAHIEAD